MKTALTGRFLLLLSGLKMSSGKLFIGFLWSIEKYYTCRFFFLLFFVESGNHVQIIYIGKGVFWQLELESAHEVNLRKTKACKGVFWDCKRREDAPSNMCLTWRAKIDSFSIEMIKIRFSPQTVNERQFQKFAFKMVHMQGFFNLKA